MSKILLVDDEAAIIRMLKFALMKEGYSIVTASNGREGVEVALNEKPNLIISDIMMPEMDGMDMCEKIREIQGLQDIPFIFLTAKGDMSTRIKGLQLGADDFIVKPIDFKLLIKKVQQILRYDVSSDISVSDPDIFKKVETPEILISGNFARKKPTEILQTIEGDHLTGILVVEENGVKVGEISFYKGKFITAEYKGQVAEEAFFSLLSPSDNDFKFITKPISHENKPRLAISTLIMEWTTSKVKDQEKKASLVLKRDTQFEVILVPEFFKLTANLDIQQVIKNFQKGSQVGFVLDNTDLPRDRILKILKYLISKGILKQK
ncbi:response regulator [candidate division CSSED10-310 bacterium]|uniref:Response regulator n=1 Tax=candidate division CSSED10-310 bacterium TaxID=2855610 RepID=A0ABV6Z3S2_UNCC1